MFEDAMNKGAGQFICQLLHMLPEDCVELWSCEIRAHFLSRQKYSTNIGTIVRLLLERGVFNKGNINTSPDELELSPSPEQPAALYSFLDVAVSARDSDLVKTVLEHGADPTGVELEDEDETSHPLTFAVQHRLHDVADVLLHSNVSSAMGFRTKAAELVEKHTKPGTEFAATC